MSTPQDPFSSPTGDTPGSNPSGYAGQPGGYGAPGGQPSGGPAYGQQPSSQAQGTNGMAIAALVTSLLCSPLGIILGFVAKGQIKQTGQPGNGLATAGIVIGVVGILIGILLFAGGLAATGP